MSTLRELEKFLMRETLAGHKNAKGLADVIEASGREKIMRRIANAQNPGGNYGLKTQNMLTGAELEKGEAKARFYNEPETDEAMADEGLRRFHDLFRRYP